MNGEMMKRLRIRLNLSQKEFGERFGASRDMVANIENDRVEIKEILLRHIISVFHLKEEWALTGSGDMFEDGSEDFLSELAAKYQLTAFQKNLARIVYEMPAAQQDVLLNIARQMLAESETVESDEERTVRIVRAARADADAAETDQNADKRA